MTNEIEAILFDMGGTLRRTTRRTRDEKQQVIRRMMSLTGASGSAEAFARRLSKRAKAYKVWAEQTHIELNESDLWTRWMLPDFPPQKIKELAVQLNQLYREAIGRRVVFPESREVVLELFRRGYRLGLVSNTTSSVEVPALLKELKIIGYFETITLSTVVGKRKPSPAMLLNAIQRMGIAPERCAYIGNRIDRDVVTARKANFSKTIILHDPRLTKLDVTDGSNLVPDHKIKNLRELLDIFPHRSAPEPATVFDASLSTMWGMETFPTLTDFFEFARRTGFARIELNHKVTSVMLDGIDLSRFRFSSVHEPAPADISADELKKRDWLISSTSEDCRREGVKAIKRSIDLASRLGASAIVVHSGHTSPDMAPEKKLRALIASDQRDSEEYRDIQQQMIWVRAELAEVAFESVKKSILELLTYAEKFGVCLGIENRYHYLEFPNPDELEILLGLADPNRIGFIYDVGHAQALDQMGFYPYEEWLKRFAPRIIGTHLHDVVGTTDHYAPGRGEVDFGMVAAYLPDGTFRTCEFQTFNTPEQVKAGLEFLVERGCIKSLR
ncbi:MAG TPA: HAD-IA family hydrolase [Anaerolineales bacterium]|nr:HAD-IA family hydrolase [Anaerolineales bacterium]